MSINTSDISCNIAVIGAGIAGTMAAWLLKRSGVEVLLLDKSVVSAGGGSGAAGAFVAPKIGKGGPLLDLTNRAFDFSQRFYREYFPDFFHATGLLRVPRDERDAERFALYEPYNHKPYEKWDRSKIEQAGYSNISKGFFFPEAGDCDAQDICRFAADSLNTVQMDVLSLHYDRKKWRVEGKDGSVSASVLILATGYMNDLLDMRYMGVKGLWGSRGDYRTSFSPAVSIHKDFSISTRRSGVVKLGATHVKSAEPCMSCDGKPLASLEKKAAAIADVSDFAIAETICGMRAGSRDHFPLAGRIVDVDAMFKTVPNIKRGAKAELIHHPDIYIINGMGGRGFVFAPFVANMLVRHIVHGENIDPLVNPDRLFFKWVRRLDNIPG